MMLIIYLVKMTLISGLLYCYYWCFLRNKQFHHYNRYLLLNIPIIAATVPLLHIPLPFAGIANDNDTIRLLRVGSGNWEEAVTITAQRNFFRIFFNWQFISFLIYSLGAFMLLITMLRSLSYIRKIARHYPGEPINDIYFFQTDEPGTPFSFFKRIFWSNKLNIESTEGQQIFRHELYHVRQNHSADILFLESMTVLTWFNPFIYLIKKEVKAIHEFLADEYAISDSNRYAYAELLVMQSIRNKQSHILNPFFHNQIKRRITMITQLRNTKSNYMSRMMILPVLFLLFCAFAGNVNRKKSLTPEAKTITVVIDAGHGGIDAGSTASGGINEKDIALKISKKILEASKNYNVRVVMTREKDELPGGANNITDGLKNRTDIANKNKADLFVSIHLNSTNNPSETGFAFFIADNDAALAAKNVQLGSTISEAIKKDYAVADQITKVNHGVAVLTHSSIPAIIVECGFITNTNDLSYISNEENQEKIAKDILEGIVKFSQQNTSKANTNVFPNTTDSLPPGLQKLNPSDIKELRVTKDKKTVVVILKNGDTIISKNVNSIVPVEGAIFTKVEVEADFPGGQTGWTRYLSKALHYPDSAIKDEIQGDVLTEFIVNNDGSISDVKAVSGPEVLKPESIRVIKESGKWIPAMENGQVVASFRRQPIKYRLEKQ